MGQMSDSEQCLNQFKFDLISLLVKFLGELGPIITRYDLLGARRVILSNVQTSHLTMVLRPGQEPMSRFKMFDDLVTGAQRLAVLVRADQSYFQI